MTPTLRLPTSTDWPTILAAADASAPWKAPENPEWLRKENITGADPQGTPNRRMSDVGVESRHRSKNAQEQRVQTMDRITVNPGIHFGKPCVAGTRITVQSVLELLDDGLSFSEIIREYYPDLTREDIRACTQYAIALVAAEDIHLSAVPA